MSEIRKYYDSRWVEGKLLELDFSQLEIFVLAHLTGDVQLKKDLLSGADLHAISAEALFGKGFTKAERKVAKMLSFQLQYGSGARNMAETNSIPIGTAKQFIENYYKRYPQVKEWQDMMIENIRKLRYTSDLRTSSGIPAGVAKWQSSTGRIYTFIEKDAPDFLDVATSFSPTQIKNFPVQGLATADIVPVVLGKVYRALKVFQRSSTNTVLLVNTVHDSILFDCENTRVAKVWANVAKRTMEDAPKYLKEIFNIDFEMPLKVGIEWGDNWGEMKELDIGK